MNKLKSFPFIYQLALSILNRVGYFNWKFKRNFSTYQLTSRWKERIDLVLQAPDNMNIERVPGAGKLTEHFQYMHNGLKIGLGSYYDYGNTRLLQENQGVHEPQEEYVFQEVLRQIKPGSAMLELGSYWAFYSMWFHASVTHAQCYMVEPDPYKMNFGKRNFALNNMSGNFIKGFIADQPGSRSTPPTLTVDQITEDAAVERWAVLHSDIQGYEHKMLQGAHHTLSQQRADFIFISTHSNELHRQCLDTLADHHYRIVADADLDESYSWDGLIVAHSPSVAPPLGLEISKKSR